MSDAFDLLGVADDADRPAVRRAYARKLRVTNPEDDPEGFKRLRAAYEAALEHIAWLERWGGDAANQGFEVALDQDQLDALLGPELRAPIFRTEPVAEPAAGPVAEPPPHDTGEVSALLAERAAERALLDAALRTLDTALRGVWRTSDDELEALFNDVLAAPAMAEIAVQAEVEAWAADLVAATIPRSDAILLQAVTRFGWSMQTQRGASYDIAACLARIDEWRLIEELGHHRHPLNASWRSLTRPPGGWLFWRIDALRPGVASGVDTLLGRRGEIAPGLAFSLKPTAVARWERLLDRPHLTLPMLAAAPFAALLAFIVGASLNPDRQAVLPTPAGLWATLAAALLAPVLLFALHAARYATERRALAGWARGGWIVGYVALGAFAAALPAAAWSVAAFGGGALVVWAWMTATTAPPSRIAFGAQVKAIWLSVALFGLLGLFGLLAVAVPHALILFGMAMLYLAVRLGGWMAGFDVLDRAGRSIWSALAIVVAVFVPMGVAALALRGQVPGYFWFYGVGLATLALQPVLMAARLGLDGTRSAAAIRVVRVLLPIAIALAWMAAIAALPSVPEPVAPVPVPVPEQGPGEPVPSTTAPGTLRGETVAALGERDTDRALAVLAERQPGFGQIAEDNPALYGKLRDAVALAKAGRMTPEETANVVTTLIAQSYRDRLAATSDSLVREEFAIRLARLEALQRESDGACTAPRWQFDELTLTEAVRRRQTEHALKVAANPMRERHAAFAQALGGAAWDSRAARLAQADADTYRSELAGARGAQRQCVAMIARLRVLTDDADDTGAALGPAMRDALLREQASADKPLE